VCGEIVQRYRPVWPLNTFWTVYLGLGLLCTLFELAWPAHRMNYRNWKGIPLDLVGGYAYQFWMYPYAVMVTSSIKITYFFPLTPVPFALRAVTFYLLADLGSYWMHRLMHSRHVWRVHRFHHSSTELYWLAGVRATFPQQVLFNVPYIWVAPLLAGAPRWFFLFMMVEGVARNHWQHMNFTPRTRWMEYLLVTPRYHHLHHSADHRGNYGSLFTLWDRFFGTRIDPDVETVKKFGTGDDKERNPLQMMIGF
jgi:sterol desaturase/sphingolipid hydroxylase (fatty acid hydroxylase superfamily)